MNNKVKKTEVKITLEEFKELQRIAENISDMQEMIKKYNTESIIYNATKAKEQEQPKTVSCINSSGCSFIFPFKKYEYEDFVYDLKRLEIISKKIK